MKAACCSLVVALLVGFVFTFGVVLAAGPLKEQTVQALVESGFDDEEILAKLAKEGIAFEANDEALARLKTAGASDAVLEAVKKAKRAEATPAATKPVITFDAVLKLLASEVDSDLIIARLRKSPSLFTLSAEQEQQLRDTGASDELIRAMKEGTKESDAAEPISDLALVLDVSGSMKESTADGRPKIDVAKEVVSDLVRKIPEGLNVSVVIYGHAQGCSAVKLLRPLQELKSAERESLAASVQGLQAVGNTPIALALRRAGEQFAGRKTHCGVVLITDGIESCNGDPAGEAARLAENPLLRFGVNVVGFGLKAEESAATAQIAASGKGKYYDAQDREQLLAAVGDVTKKLEQGAKPTPFNPATPTGRRAVVVAQPKVQMPALKEIVLVKPGASYYTVNSYEINRVSKYEAELRQPTADKVDIWLWPEKGLPILMVAEFENPQREVKRLAPEDYVGLVRLTSEDKSSQARVVVTTPESGQGTVDTYKVQELVGYNQDMIVPAGTYMVWVVEPDQKPVLLEDGVQVSGGHVTALER